MSFLNELRKQRRNLKGTQTIVTRVDGVKYMEGSGTLLERSHGFVVDTKPDDIPILIVNYIYIGSQDCADNKILDKYNIKNVLSLGVNVVISNINHKFVPILDLPESNIRLALNECLPFMRNSVGDKQNVLVHCNAGVSRTAMVVIAYLMHYEGMHFEEAYNLVKSKRPKIQPNEGFKKQLRLMKPYNVV